MSKPIPVEAITRQRYNGVWYLPGETFEVESESEFADMVASRPPLVKRVKSVEQTYETRTVAATDAPQAQPAAAPQKGKYDRRDLRAR